ncbi:MAG: PilZ domain-containing protein [Candidatus Omnitrophota bacterium]|nr:PilZ domain-containing protein [Candidatus Omnitrophota bacterium]
MVIGRHGQRLDDRRRWHRVQCSAPVQFCIGTAQKGGVSSFLEGRSTDLSVDGLYLTTRVVTSVAPGDPLTVSIRIPLERRRSFPFSRIVGLCRVVRVEDLEKEWVGGSEGQVDTRQPAGKAAQGLALAFCEGVTRLGAMIIPS